jgi:hypothetical protein
MPTTVATLAKHYDALAAGERLAAVLDAMACGDYREAGRLRRACPRRDYTAPDRAFADRVLLAFEAASLAAVDLRALCARGWTRSGGRQGVRAGSPRCTGLGPRRRSCRA